jgi:hypothetical protein
MKTNKNPKSTKHDLNEYLEKFRQKSYMSDEDVKDIMTSVKYSLSNKTKIYFLPNNPLINFGEKIKLSNYLKTETEVKLDRYYKGFLWGISDNKKFVVLQDQSEPLRIRM